MDPESTLQLLERSITDGQLCEAVQALNDYYRWRLRDGFEPRDGDARADRLANRLCDVLGAA